MKNQFKSIMIGYLVVWIIAIICICGFVWNRLSRFQLDYEAEKRVLNSQEQGGNNTDQPDDDNRLAPEMITLSYDYVKPQLEGLRVTAYSNMQIFVDGEKAETEVETIAENHILADYSQLTGKNIEECVYIVGTMDKEQIVVKNSKGEILEAPDLDYTNSVYSDNPEMSSKAVQLFEQYLKHISKMVTLEELQEVMRSSSKAYKAVRNSQKSLEWMIAAKQMTFTKEETKNMWMIDENHMICDVHIDLTKITENNRTVNESVKYRVLYENVSGKWYIYSFEIIA